MARLAGLGLLIIASLPLSVRAAVVLNPVTAPVLPGVTVSIERFGTAPALEPASGRTARIQQLKPAGDNSGRVFINDTAGYIEVAGKAGGTPSIWFDIHAHVPDLTTATDTIQQGLLSFAFHPNFAGDPGKTGYGTFYIVDTERSAPGTPARPVDHLNVVREFTVADPTAATASITASRQVYSAEQPYRDHGPGTIAFNPIAKPGDADYGKLYIGMGDGGGIGDPLGNAQNLASPLGKILRIDPADPDGAGAATFTVPSDNPAWSGGGALPEVWAYGLRNPQSFSWDASGRMLIGEVGQSQLEEINVGAAKANYGWPLREGMFARDPAFPELVFEGPVNDGRYVDPIAQYDHEEIARRGFVLAALSSVFGYSGGVGALDGTAILSDLVSGRVFYFPLAGAGVGGPAMLSELLFSLNGASATFADLDGTFGRVDLRLGEDGDGELYFLSKTNGNIYRLVSDTVPEPATWLQFILGLGLLGAVERRRNPRRGYRLPIAYAGSRQPA